MTAAWDRVKASGSGQLHFRIRIEGFPYEPVTSADMEGTASDGRVRYAGLRSRGIRLSERVDLPTARWEPRGFRITIADVNRRWTEAFRAPTAVTYLAADATAAATAYSVKATASFDTSGQIWCDSETASYGAKTSAGFSGLTRGIWQTLAQAHYTADGELLRYPEVTNWPRVREGRRVSLFVYGAGDPRTATDDGNLLWTGVVSTEPQFDGLLWKIGIDPISRKWSQDVGGDLEDPSPIRGIYYPASAPLVVDVIEYTTTAPAVPVAQTRFAVSGFWETQEEFCDELTSTLATQLAAPEDPTFTQTVVAIPYRDTWAFSFDTGATPHYMTFEVFSAVDQWTHADQIIDRVSDRGVPAVETSRSYFAPVVFGEVPRAVIGDYSPSSGWTRVLAASRKINVDPATNPEMRIHLGGRAAVTANLNYVAVDWDSNGAPGGSEDPVNMELVSASPTNRSIVLDGLISGPGVFSAAVGSERVQVRMGRLYGFGHLGDFIDTLTGEVPANLNRGAAPDIRSSDFVAMTSTDIPEVAAASPLVNRRGYSVFSPVSFGDVVKEECKLAGLVPAYDSSGLVTFHKLRLAMAGEVATRTITAADIITGKGEWLRYEIAPLGMFNTVDLKTGYSPTEDEHLGRLRRVRDVEAFGRAPDGRTLEIAPLSTDRGVFTHMDIVRQMARVLGVFGAPYYYVSFACKLTLIDLLVADIVKITWDKIPNADGTLGVTNKIGYVVAREWTPRLARGRVTLLLTDQNVAGYVPAAKLTVTDGTSGTTGPFTATADDTYFPGTTTAADFWNAGDKVRLFAYNSTSTVNNVTATIDSDPVGDVVIFTTDANWAHAGQANVLGSQVSTAITAASQRQYCYEANADVTVDWSGDTGNDAFTMAP